MSPGDYRLGKPFEAVQVPATVQAILAARIDRLQPDTKRVLQCAAVVGQYLRYPILRLVTEMTDEELLRKLDQLQSAGILFESSLFPELAYTFKHALTQAVAYQGILQDERRTLHRRVAEALETLYPDRMQEYGWAIVSHYERAGSWAKVARIHKSF